MDRPCRNLAHIWSILLVLLSASGSLAQASLSPDEVRADIRYFARFLEQTHPDPYTAFGGRVAFGIEIQGMLDGVPDDGLAQGQVYDLLRSFLGRMGDGHSYVQAPSPVTDDSQRRYLPVRFKVTHDEVVVVEAKDSHSKLIGSRLHGAAGLDLEALRNAARNVLPKENAYAASALAVRLLSSDTQVRRMLPGVANRLELRLVDQEDAEFSTVVEYSLTRDERDAHDWVGARWEQIPGTSGPIATAIWPERNAAYLGLRTIMAREAFEEMKVSGRTDLREHLSRFYRRNLGTEMPADVDEALSETPSICQASHALLTSMKERGIENLIVDLRGNGGGWSTIMKPLYYMLHGDRFFESNPVQYVTRFSDGYLRILGTDLAAYNEAKGTSYEIGDLRISGGEAIIDPAATRLEWLADLLESSPDCHALLSGLDGRPLYAPKVFVITDPETFSAAYDTAYHLRRLGAETVGVPPSQSAHSFVEGTPFKLPNSGLEGAISRTAVIYPDLPERDGAFLLDRPMTFEIMQRYDLDLEAEVRYVLDLVGEGGGD